jgi:hypothetical protein
MSDYNQMSFKNIGKKSYEETTLFLHFYLSVTEESGAVMARCVCVCGVCVRARGEFTHTFCFIAV